MRSFEVVWTRTLEKVLNTGEFRITLLPAAGSERLGGGCSP